MPKEEVKRGSPPGNTSGDQTPPCLCLVTECGPVLVSCICLAWLAFRIKLHLKTFVSTELNQEIVSFAIISADVAAQCSKWFSFSSSSVWNGTVHAGYILQASRHALRCIDSLKSLLLFVLPAPYFLDGFLISRSMSRSMSKQTGKTAEF